MTIAKISNFQIGRRQLLTAAGSAMALGMLGGLPALVSQAKLSPTTASLKSDPFNIRFVVTDRRLPQSMVFAQQYTETGSTPLEITEGLTQMWQQSLEPLWRERNGAVAGLTTREVWECLAEQARSQSHRTVVLQQHDVTKNKLNPLVSWIIA